MTIVVATYNRPSLLRCTIESIRKQTFQDWVLLVVGDCCDEQTGQVIEGFADDRIFYVNLKQRCGEQSGPNTAGMFVARTKYVAFANHDDIWLPDHLERALAVLEAGRAEFYAGAAALSIQLKDPGTQEYRFGIGALSPPSRSPEAGFAKSPAYFEPVSSWVMHSTLLRKVGAWRPAGGLYRTPLEDWILRAWRADVSLCFDDVVTVIYCSSGRGGNGEALDYKQGDEENRYWLDLMTRHNPERLRAHFANDAKSAGLGKSLFEHTMRNHELFWVFEHMQNGDGARVYKRFGWDGFEAACKVLGREPGFRLRQMLKRRTGEDLENHKDWRRASHEVKAALQSDDRWQKVFVDD